MQEEEQTALEEEQTYRASAYGLLAALLRDPPSAALLEHLVTLSPRGDYEPDDITEAMAALSRAAAEADPERCEDEFNALFIGLGRGEVVPYGSWYLTGYLMEQPLSDLREDLRRLGFERSEGVSESEDHVAALFEVFSVMISDSFGIDEQRQFYVRHLEPWLDKFLTDLGNAKSADFYRAVARFGGAFARLEATYLKLDE